MVDAVEVSSVIAVLVALPAVNPDAVPETLVIVPLVGVPNAPSNNTTAPALPVLTPRAVTTPEPVVVVVGVAPAPPPSINALAVNRAEVAQVDVLVK